jgi:hypothetical protein
MTKQTSPTPDHLGGHLNKTHIDAGALDFLIERLPPIRRMLDIGCGPGGMRELAKVRNIEWLGIDGDPKFDGDPEIRIHDFSQGKFNPPGLFTLGWSVEFLEHVEEEYLPNLEPVWAACDYLCITHAPPGWPGHHHVNCQPAEYWIEHFTRLNFGYEPALSTGVRHASSMNKNFMQRTGLVFRRKLAIEVAWR